MKIDCETRNEYIVTLSKQEVVSLLTHSMSLSDELTRSLVNTNASDPRDVELQVDGQGNLALIWGEIIGKANNK